MNIILIAKSQIQSFKSTTLQLKAKNQQPIAQASQNVAEGHCQ